MGSLIGGIAATQECIEFCDKHDIKPAIEIVKGDQIIEVFEKLTKKNDSITRYVLDIDASF